jgi:predicted amidohydrolase
MKDALHVHGLQTPLIWESPEANLAAFEAQFAHAPADADVLVLPEMWATGFTMRPELHAEPAEAGPAFAAMQRWAAATGALICGSLSVRDGAHFRNRHYAVEPGGRFRHYDKRHAFTFAGEHAHYTPGTERVVVEWQGWRLLLLTCYDLRFPVFARNQPAAPYDGIIIVANWPAVRSDAWATLLRARAIENQAHCIGVNRTGEDGNGMAHDGRSACIDPYGRGEDVLVDGWFGARWEAQALANFRAKFPVLHDADPFTLG